MGGPRPLAAFLCAVAASACYTYTPVELADVTPASEVRARVTANFAEESAQILGREERLMVGSVEELGGGGLMLRVSVVSSLDRRGGDLSQRLSIPADQILEVELKERDRTRTALLLSAVGVIGGSLVVAVLNGEERATSDPPKDPTTEEPIFRFPIRFGIGW